MSTLRRHAITFGTVALGVAGADAYTKTLAFSEVGPGGKLMLIPDFLRISCERNSGIVLGLGADWSSLWAAVSTIAVIGLVAGFFSIYNLRWIMTFAMGFLLGGAAGNAFDRIADGSVRDFIGIFWAGSNGVEGRVAFNLADLSLVAGALLMEVDLRLAREPETRRSRFLERPEAWDKDAASRSSGWVMPEEAG